MGKYHYKIAAALSLMVLGLFGCELEQEVPIPDHEPRLTLRLALSNVKPDSIHYWSGPHNQLFIGRSQGVLDNKELDGVTNATVTLYNEAGQVVESYRHSGKLPSYYFGSQGMPGYYDAVNGFIPEPDKNYTMRVSAPGFEPIEATVRLPASTTITEASLTDLAGSPYGTIFLEGNLRVSFRDNPNEQNYYRVVAYPADSTGARLGYDTVYPQVDRSDPGFGVQEQLLLGMLFSDELYQSGQITLTNRVSLTAFDGRYLMETGKKRNTFFVEVHVQQLSKDEYLFHKTITEQRNVSDNPFAEYAQVHSNIRGGYGVLGGVTITKQLIPIR